MKALVVVNCFPPLLKNAGGVSKRYLTLCRALIEGLGWQVTLMTPVNVRCSNEDDVMRWLKEGKLVHLPARGVRIESAADGVAVFLDLFSAVNAGLLLNELFLKRDYDCIFTDDLAWRIEFLLLTRATGLPTVTTTHTDITHMPSCKGCVKLAWNLHILSAHLASVHATVSQVFGSQMSKKYNIPVGAVWPPILWSQEFKSEPATWAQRAAAQRATWLERLKAQGCTPKAIMVFAGRWSGEKRIHLLFDAVPKDCALVICGDGTSEYATAVEHAGPPAGRLNVLPLRKMLNAVELRVAYAASDLFLSASNFETLGNTVIEAFCSGTPVAVQPAQGHLEFVKDQKNSWFVDYNDQDEARATLSRIVASGLDAESLNRALPDFAPLGQKFRSANFAKDFDEAVLQPALAVGRQQRVGAGCNAMVELAKRICCFVTCFFVWFLLRFATRVVFVTSRDPKFAILGELGAALDDGRGETIVTLPCLRWLVGSKWLGSTSIAESQSPRAVDDYEGHYRKGYRTALKKWFQTWHEVMLMLIAIVCVLRGSVPMLRRSGP
mmetsp:Transcript_31493/g.91057  ORF Transcript_31493/g.91057 Transcript_31493/m.91057 type:complete len:552 (-) Transcript_31493:87-1742(-)|eukprot:CAMPEP_0177180822 /NCGR_PEP_ID=MMETSP0367-20130122/15595_1 /TAXON_ID=447022 ORGANISM="Scrippsiella hangoei-like, Strain SHHI-4" /NCGR_SAMPLE_ID=MMETSP0367 /ASSEMBLY_ACC=CAM_ASM_000362 /LENGTH=551 /DNA_ID=CAMNT_0018627629 /DNA_START=41 /DNA_END=1699 /DNA_ORIENTATION=+